MHIAEKVRWIYSGRKINTNLPQLQQYCDDNALKRYDYALSAAKIIAGLHVDEKTSLQLEKNFYNTFNRASIK
jgi:hypothetical protein